MICSVQQVPWGSLRQLAYAIYDCGNLDTDLVHAASEFRLPMRRQYRMGNSRRLRVVDPLAKQTIQDDDESLIVAVQEVEAL